MLVLASRSPRRAQLLKEAGYVFKIVPASDAAEDAKRPAESPLDYVRRLALQKAEDVASKIESGRVIACDTIVVCRGEILEKPLDIDDARRMHLMLRGERHEVISGLCAIDVPGGRAAVDHAVTVLEMSARSDEEIENYLTTRAWEGKAGGFGYQDGLDWVKVVEGSESNVVGLPMELLAEML